jgi:hypothetical protein
MADRQPPLLARARGSGVPVTGIPRSCGAARRHGAYIRWRACGRRPGIHLCRAISLTRSSPVTSMLGARLPAAEYRRQGADRRSAVLLLDVSRACLPGTEPRARRRSSMRASSQ